ncbi:hypothetical protein AAFN75_00530 [Algibacter sp. AS12]|uniref:hypothetical protein n=1 Tax=Algibacter sp. AS12 TaxID=3135773 RepID=UPI00398BABD3
MKIDREKIFKDDSDVDIAHKINTMELDNWINHLTYIEKELTNLIGIYGIRLNEKLDGDRILNRLVKKQEENKTLLNALNGYAMKRTKIIECDDMQCDMVYITEHESYRRSYLYHLDKYRRVKDEFFKEVHDEFSLLKPI